MHINREIHLTHALQRTLAATLTGAALFSAGLMLPACDSEDAVELRAGEQLAYDGETLFEAIFFGQGAAAKALEGLYDEAEIQPQVLDAEQTHALIEQVSGALDEHDLPDLGERFSQLTLEQLEQGGEASPDIPALLMMVIAEQDPGFFDAFADDIQSGEHLRVDAAMGEAAEQLARALDNAGMNAQLEAEAGPGSTCLVAAVAWAVVAVAQGAVVVQFATAIHSVHWFQVHVSRSSSGDGKDLEYDAVVDRITTTFAPN